MVFLVGPGPGSVSGCWRQCGAADAAAAGRQHATPPASLPTHLPSRFSARRAFSSFFAALPFFLLLAAALLRGRPAVAADAAGCWPGGNLKALRPPLSPSPLCLRHHQKPTAAAAATASRPSAELAALESDWARAFLQRGRWGAAAGGGAVGSRQEAAGGGGCRRQLSGHRRNTQVTHFCLASAMLRIDSVLGGWWLGGSAAVGSPCLCLLVIYDTLSVDTAYWCLLAGAGRCG